MFDFTEHTITSHTRPTSGKYTSWMTSRTKDHTGENEGIWNGYLPFLNNWCMTFMESRPRAYRVCRANQVTTWKPARLEEQKPDSVAHYAMTAGGEQMTRCPYARTRTSFHPQRLNATGCGWRWDLSLASSSTQFHWFVRIEVWSFLFI